MADVAETMLSLEVSRHFAASPERVFDAWLSKDWGAWLPPRGARCEITRIEPHVGGGFHFKMTMPDGRAIEGWGVYREVTRPTKLSMTWVGSYNHQETVITVTFRPERGGTLMTLRQDGFTSDELRQGYTNGWSGEGGSFDKLAAVLAQQPA